MLNFIIAKPEIGTGSREATAPEELQGYEVLKVGQMANASPLEDQTSE